MKMKWLKIAVLMSGTMVSYGATLEFTNVTQHDFPGYNNTLRAVAYGTTSNFVAVGDNLSVVAANFTPGVPFLNSTNWQAGGISNTPWTGTNLYTVASSGAIFLASGGNNLLFSTVDGTRWVSNSAKIFNNAAQACGLAFNGGKFVAAGAADVDLAYTGATPPTTNWTVATLTSPSFIESFRGVTPFGSNGFAACGLFGDVRTATNAASAWAITPFSKVGEPDFYGIADDGNKTIVCVGATNATTAAKAGIIMTSTNGGTTWTTSYLVTNFPITNSINAVAYTGFGFIAAADGGYVLTSSNGLAPWTSNGVPVVGVSSNLYGVVYANSNDMNGVCEIVGASGNVILAALPPPNPVNLGNLATCFGSTTQLVVTTSNSVGTNLVTADWYVTNNVSGGYTQVISNSFVYTPPIWTGTNVNTTNYFYVQARDLRTGFLSTNYTTVVWTNFMRPIATLVTSNVICNGVTNNLLQMDLAGNGPWTVKWTDGFTNYTFIATNQGVWLTNSPLYTNFTIPGPGNPFNPTNVFADQPTNHIYWISNLADAFFPTDVPTNFAEPAGSGHGGNWTNDLSCTNIIRVNPRPQAVLITTNTICDGEVFTSQAILHGLGPWTVTWSDGFIQTTNSLSGAGPLLLTRDIPTNEVHDVLLNLQTNFTFTITSISNQDTCLGNQPGDITGTNLVYVNPRPRATLVTSQTICNGAWNGVVLRANLTGLGPWTVLWSDGFTQTTNAPVGSGATVTRPVTANEVTNLLANLSTNFIFTVTSVSNSDMCLGNLPGDLTCTNTVTVDPRPTASLVTSQTICNGAWNSVVLTANLTGLGPWTVLWSDGVTQTTNANVGSGATMIRPVTANQVTNLLANLSTNFIFTVTSVSNQDTCLGNQPGDLTCTNSVTVDPRPTASLVTSQTICNGAWNSVVLTANLTGISPWTVLWSDGVVQTTNAGVNSPATITRTVTGDEVTNLLANLATNFTFTVTGVSNQDTCLGNQPGDLTCTNSVTVDPRPTASLVTSQTICNGAWNSVVLTANLTGLGPWTVAWSDGVVQTTNANIGSGATMIRPVTANQVTNLLANLSTNFIFTVTGVSNQDTCLGNQPGDLTCTNSVTVDPRPMASLVTSQTICNGAWNSVVLTANLTGLGPWTVLWSDGVVQATNASVGSPATITRTVTGDEVTNLLANLSTNFIFTVTGVSNQDTCLGNQPGDLTCTNSVTVNPRPTASLVTSQTICNGAWNSVVLTANLTGLGPWTVLWSDNVTQTTNASVGSGATITRTVTANEVTNLFANLATNLTFTVTGVSNQDTCLGNQPGDLTCTNSVTVDPRPTASLVTSQTICNGAWNSVVLTANLTGLGPWTVAWSDGVVQTTNASVGSGAIMVRPVTPNEVTNLFANLATNFIFTVTGVTNLDTCLGNQPGDLTCTNSVTVDPRPTASLVTSQTICNGAWSSVVLTANLTGISPWTVLWSDGVVQTTNAGVNSPATITRTVTANEVTNLFANLATNFNFTVTSVSNQDTCLGNQPGDLTSTNSVTVDPRPTASLVTTQTNCNGDWNSVILTANLTGLGPWTVAWSDNFTQTTNAPAGSGATIVRPVTANEVTNLFANLSTNFVFTVTGVTNLDTCLGNQPGDLTSTNTVIVNPLPTALVVQTTNTYVTNYTSVSVSNLLTFDDLPDTESGLQVTNGYNELCWSNFYELDGLNLPFPSGYSNGVVSASNVCINWFGGPASITNSTPFDFASGYFTAAWYDNLQLEVQGYTNGALAYDNNYILNTTNPTYLVLNYSNVTEVQFIASGGTLHGGYSGGGTQFAADNLVILTNTTPQIQSITAADQICNGSGTGISNILTGVGPWTVVWSDGLNSYTQAVGSGAGPFPYTLQLPAGALNPTNQFANASSNFTYTITSVSTPGSCSGSSAGSDLILVNPRPTAVVSGSTNFYVGNTNSVSTTIQAALTGIGPWVVTWSDGYIQTNVTSLATRLITTNLPGLVYTNYVLTNYGGYYNSHPHAPYSYVTNNNLGAKYNNSILTPHFHQWYVIFGANTNYFIGTNQVTSSSVASTVVVSNKVVSLTDANCSANEPNDLLSNAVVLVTPGPAASLVAGSDTNLCQGSPATLQAILSGTPPWTIYWSDGTMQTSAVNVAAYNIDTTALLAGSYTYTITNLTDATGTAKSNNINGSVTFNIYTTPPLPTAPSGALIGTDLAGDILETNVLGTQQVLAVQTSASTTGLWSDSNGNTLTNSAVYLATNPVCGFYTNSAAAQVTNTVTQCTGPAVTVIQVLVPPAPVSGGNLTNNVLVPNPALSVTTYTDGANPPGAITADWYDAPTGGNLLRGGSLQFTPTNNQTGTYTFWVQARDVNSGLTSITLTAVNLTLVTNPPCLVSYQTNNYLVASNLITFDDLPNDSVISSYSGLSWLNFTALDGTDYAGPSGYNAGVVSPKGIAYGQDGVTSTITNSTPFSLVSAYLTAAWYDNLQVTVLGYYQGVLLYSNVYVPSATTPTNFIFNYFNVTEVDFTSSGGSPHAGYGSVGAQYVLDNLVVSNGTIITTNVDCSAVPISPLFIGNYTNCAGTVNPPLLVGVTDPSQLVNWYADATGTNLLARNVATNAFVPTNAAPGTYPFYAQAVATNEYVSPNPLTPVTLALLDCLSTNASISVVGGTNISVSWFGDLELQGATNLAPPVTWVDIFTNPVVGWTNIIQTNGNPPIEFFRVVVP
ncbi:MAG TPA: hypothetical protein VK742_14720 [Candidatus Sulfotelmatobacter sp.]|nr:hypothetical protein [Candidatus Sulfotelmatobacter sp.]